MKLGLGSLLALLVVGTTAAQKPTRTAAELATALAGIDAATVAWAAHDARDLADKKLRGALLTALGRWCADKHDSRIEVCLHVMDALVGLGARVPADCVAPFVEDEDCGVVAFVLLAREPQQNERLLLQMFRRGWIDAAGSPGHHVDLRTWAIGNLLAAQGAPGFAALLVHDLQLDLDICIGQEPARITHFFSISRPRFPQSPAAGFPPRPVYELSRAEGVPGLLLVPGSIPVHYRRWAFDAARKVVSLAVPDRPTCNDGLDWLRSMAGLDTQPGRRLEFAVVDVDHYVKDVVEARDKLQLFVTDLRTRLVARGAMTIEEAKPLARKVAVHIEDTRSSQQPPLPKIPDAR